mgnify:FL=1
MRRLCTSDWQLTDNPRDRYRTTFVVNEIPKLVEKYKPDQLIFLGDLTENKDEHPASLVNEVVEFFSFISCKTDVIILQGNHDFLHKEHPFFAFVENFKNIHWISKPEVLDGCLYLPHTRDYKQDWKDVDFKGHDFIFCHNLFDGVKANGQKLSGIPTSIFPDDAVVLSGDVHEPQELDGGKVIYVGSPFLTDFGDDFQPRILLLDDLKIKSIKVYGPQKRVIEATPEQGVGGPLRFRHSPQLHTSDIVKIKVNIGMEHVAEWDKWRSLAEKWAIDRGLVVNSIIPVVSYDVGERAKPVKGQRKSDKQYLEAFVSRSGIDKKTAEIGKEIVDQV